MSTALSRPRAAVAPAVVQSAADVQRQTLDGLSECLAERVSAILPDPAERAAFLQTVLLHVQTEPGLAACEPVSIIRACVLIARNKWVVGRHCYLYARTTGGRSVAVLHDGYRGLLDLAYRAGCPAAGTVLVHERDTVAMTDGVVRHTCNPFADRGALVGVWAWITLPSGHRVDEVVSLADLRAAKATAPAGGPWHGPWESQMQRKFALRRALRNAPSNPVLDATIAELDAMEYADPPPRQVAAPAPAQLPAPAAPSPSLAARRRPMPAAAPIEAPTPEDLAELGDVDVTPEDAQ